MTRIPLRPRRGAPETAGSGRCHDAGVTKVGVAAAGIVAGGVLVGFLSASYAYDMSHPWLWVTDLATTVAFAAVAARSLGSVRWVSALAVGFCVSWALAGWVEFAVYWHRGVLIHLLVLLFFGSLWPKDVTGRLVIVAGYAASITPYVWRSSDVALVLALALLVGAAAALRLTPHPAHAQTLAVSASIVVGLLMAAAAGATIIAPGRPTLEVRAVAYACGLVGVAVLAGLASRPAPLARATDAVLELGASRNDAVRDRLAKALGDPSLEVGWWTAERRVFTTTGGAEVSAPAGGGERRGLTVEVDGQRVALVVGDAARLDESGVRDAILRASDLATEHARLAGRIRAATRDVEESRGRLIRAAEAERVALADELEREVGTPLRALGQRLAGVDTSDPVRRAIDLVDRALGELAALASGLQPSALCRGLAAALAQLADQTPLAIAVRVDENVDDPAIAQVTYYVCAEAITNAVRHADCTKVAVHVRGIDGALEVLVEDDGRGGVITRPGSGLDGLHDRVASVGGTLDISSQHGRGTVVRARLPAARVPAPVEVSR